MPEALALEPHRPSSIAFPLLTPILFLFFVSAIATVLQWLPSRSRGAPA